MGQGNKGRTGDRVRRDGRGSGQEGTDGVQDKKGRTGSGQQGTVGGTARRDERTGQKGRTGVSARYVAGEGSAAVPRSHPLVNRTAVGRNWPGFSSRGQVYAGVGLLL